MANVKNLDSEQLVRDYQSMNIPAIARKYGVSDSCITRRLQKAGVTFRRRGVNECYRPEERKRKTDYAVKAAELGLCPSRYVRLLAVRALGSKCVRCGETDLRVLQINHIDGEGVERYDDGRRKTEYRTHLKIIEGQRPKHLEVRCANCNIIHEYERGNCKVPTDWFVV